MFVLREGAYNAGGSHLVRGSIGLLVPSDLGNVRSVLSGSQPETLVL